MLCYNLDCITDYILLTLLKIVGHFGKLKKEHTWPVLLSFFTAVNRLYKIKFSLSIMKCCFLINIMHLTSKYYFDSQLRLNFVIV